MARFNSLPLINFGLALVFSIFSFNAVSQTSLSAGDAAFIGVNSDGDDDISFILLKDVDVGTVIKITDQGWNDVGSAFFIADDDSTGLVWVATSSLARGTTVHIQTTAAGTPIAPVASLGSVSGAIELTDNSGLIPDDGDQLFMYQGPELAPVFISGVHWNSELLTTGLNWDLAAFNSASSNLPDQLTNGVNAVWLYGPLLMEKRNFRFDCSLVSATVTNLRLALSDINNWEVATGSTAYTQNPFPCSFTILCDEPSVPTVVADNAGLCGTETTSLTISGDLGEATSWEVYTGSCAGTNIGSTAGASFAISPGADETYYIRGEGGCATPGVCATASVTVSPEYSATENVNVCFGSSYTAPDGTLLLNLLSQTVHTSTLTSSGGCDSVIVTTIDVNTVYMSNESQMICSGDDFTFPDGTTVSNITAQLIHTSNLLTALTGCDSIIVTTVDVNPVYLQNESATICAGSDYTFPDGTVVNNITSQVVQTSNLLTAATTCDSIIITTVDVNPVYLQNESNSICSGADYTFPDGTVVSDITSQVVHTSNLVSAITGCDSIIISTIDVNAVYLQSEATSICFGEDYTFPDGTVVTDVLAQTVHTSNLLTAATGCDSIIVTTVDVLPTYSLAQSASVCSGEDFTFPDGTVVTDITAQVVQTSNLVTAITGCDSVIITTVDVNPVFLQNESVSICSGSDYTFPDGTVVSDVTAQVVQTSNLLTAATGCDSIIITTVDVNPIFLQNQGSTICSGEDFTFPDGTVITDITAQVSQTSNLVTAITGCDSIIITIVDVLPTYIETESSAICSGESYTFPDGTIVDDISAQLVHVSNLLTAGGGCDSIIVSTIDVLPVYILAQSASLCSGESFTFPDGTVVDDITEQVVHTSNLVTGSGCDSIVIYTVDVNPIYATTETAFVCPGDDFVFPDGSILTNVSDPVSYTSNLLTTSGACDSIIVTNIEINPVYLTLDTVDICQGWGYTFRDGQVIGNIETSFSYTSNLLSEQFNCDSIFITYVNVTPNYDLEESYVICSGESFTFPDGFVQENITGPTIHTSNLVTTIMGCDSTINTRIDVNPSYFSQEERTICYGEDVTLPDGSVVENVLETETFLSNFQTSSFGCDSIVSVLVNVLPIYFEEKAIEVCAGGTVELPDGTIVHNVETTFVHVSNLTSMAGCDSIVETTVVPLEMEEQEESILVCQGEDVSLPDGTVVVNIQEDETFVTVLSSQVTGCDSIIITSVEVDSPDFVQQEVTICKGSEYTFPDGTVISDINNKIAYTSQVVQDGRACYSTIETVVGVFEIDTEIVRDEFEFRAVSPVGTFQWLDCDNNFEPIVGETDAFIRADESRNVAVEITFGECKDTSICSGSLPSAISERYQLDGIDVYPNPSDGEVFVNLNGLSEVTYTLMDVQGKVIEEGNIQSNDKFAIGSMVKAGVYILSLESGGERKLVKLIRR